MATSLRRIAWLVALAAFVLTLSSLVVGCSGPTGIRQSASPPASEASAPQVQGPTAGSPGSVSEGTPRLEVGTLDQATAATGLKVAPPAWLPDGTCAGLVRWSTNPPAVYQEFLLADGRGLVFSGRGGDSLGLPDGKRVSDQGVEGFVKYVAPEPGDTVSLGNTTFDWLANGICYRLEIEGPPDETMLLAVAASVP